MDILSTIDTEKSEKRDGSSFIASIVKSDSPGHFVPLQDSKHKLPREYRDLLIISGKLILLPVVIIVGVFAGVYAGFCKMIEIVHNLLTEQGG